MMWFLWKKKHLPQDRCAVNTRSLFYILPEGKLIDRHKLSTGKPKGVLHTSAGYLLYAKLTAKYVFDLQKDDVFGCMADIGYFSSYYHQVDHWTLVCGLWAFIKRGHSNSL